MTTFISTFTVRNGYKGDVCNGALVDDYGITLFVNPHGWYEVDSAYIAHHDKAVAEITRVPYEPEPEYEGVRPHNLHCKLRKW